MTALDWVVVGAILLSVLMAAAQGFFFELFSLAGVVIGYLLAAWEYPRLAAWLLPFAKADWVANLAGFLTIFFAVLFVAGMAGQLARWILKEVGLRWVDRLLGGAFGLVRGVVIATVLVMGLAAFAPESKSLADSQVAGYFLVSGRALSWLAPFEVRERFRQGVAALRKAQQPGGPGKP